ncbi:hypothetical protein ACQUSR_15405 [Streptomyces sp. P1-3]|uniref:hypothetical protein n=1 Tax=Streptomyces sp. P1-3 TaxID=3421658 RepID=UPI003D36E82F
MRKTTGLVSMLVLAGALSVPVASAHAASIPSDCRAKIKAASGLNDKALDASVGRKYLKAADYNKSTWKKITDAKAICRLGHDPRYVMDRLTVAYDSAREARDHNLNAHYHHKPTERTRAINAEERAKDQLKRAYGHA